MLAYLASPLGFSEAGRAYLYTTMIPALERGGAVILDPWTLTAPASLAAVTAMPAGESRKTAWQTINRIIGRTNADAIDSAALVIAVLDGSDVDSGTAAEIGYAYASRKHIIGYRNDLRLSADNEGAVVNLQVEYFIRASGGDILGDLAALSNAVAAYIGTRA